MELSQVLRPNHKAITIGFITTSAIFSLIRPGITGDTQPDLDNCCNSISTKAGMREYKAFIKDGGTDVPAVISKDLKGNVARIVIRPDTEQEENICYNWAGALARHYFKGAKDCRAFNGNTLIGWKVNGQVQGNKSSEWGKTETNSVSRAQKLYYEAAKAPAAKLETQMVNIRVQERSYKPGEIIELSIENISSGALMYVVDHRVKLNGEWRGSAPYDLEAPQSISKSVVLHPLGKGEVKTIRWNAPASHEGHQISALQFMVNVVERDGSTPKNFYSPELKIEP